MKVGVEPKSLGHHKNGALTLSAMLPTICSILGEAQIMRISVKGGWGLKV